MIVSKEQEKKLWNYIGPSIIQLDPDRFKRLKELDALQIKTLMKNSNYEWYDPGQTVKLENGGILFEGELEEIDGSNENLNVDNLSAEGSEGEMKNRSIRIHSYAFIYPTTTIYRATKEIRLYAFPEVLRDSWLCFNPQVLNDAFSILPGAATSVHHQNTIRDKQNSIMRKQRTILLGIPKDLAHEDPLNTFRAGAMGASNYQSYNLPAHLQDQLGAGTILPKGYTRVMSRLPNTHTAPPTTDINQQVSKMKLHSGGAGKNKLANGDHEESKDVADTKDIKLKEKKASSTEDKSESSSGSNSEEGNSGSEESSADNQEVDEEDEDEEVSSSVAN